MKFKIQLKNMISQDFNREITYKIKFEFNFKNIYI